MRTLTAINKDIERCETQINECKKQYLPEAKTIIKGFELTRQKLMAERQTLINRLEVINPRIVSA